MATVCIDARSSSGLPWCAACLASIFVCILAIIACRVETCRSPLEHLKLQDAIFNSSDRCVATCAVAIKRDLQGRMCTLMKRQGPSLKYLEEVRQHMGRLPAIDPATRTLLVCGYPNVGKSSFMNKVTATIATPALGLPPVENPEGDETINTTLQYSQLVCSVIHLSLPHVETKFNTLQNKRYDANPHCTASQVTRADVEVQPYAFTTKSLFVGHMDYRYLRWQVIDTPGILDRPLEERNTIEMQVLLLSSSWSDAIRQIYLPVNDRRALLKAC